VDLGAAPGGWCQVAAKRIDIDNPSSKIVAIDYLDFDPITGVEQLKLDFLLPEADAKLKAMLGGEADGVLSDMAAPTTGHRNTDYYRTAALFEEGFYFAMDVLKLGGFYLGKAFRGGAENVILSDMKQAFTSVKHIKPKASRAESVELYVLATGFRGKPATFEREE
jgi:23S rRNA (uridine2552-2'-O)-methyltransferase